MKKGNSYFIFNNSITSYGCCQSIGDYVLREKGNKYLLIQKDAVLDSFKNNDIDISEYIEFLANYFKIPYTPILNVEEFLQKIKNPYITSVNQNFEISNLMIWEIGKDYVVSNKHMVGMHTMVRYMWQAGDGIGIAKLLLTLYRKFKYLYGSASEVLDDEKLSMILGIGLSYTYTQWDRSLVSYDVNLTDLVCVPNPTTMLQLAKKGQNLYGIFNHRYILSNISILVPGDLFPDEPTSLNAKNIIMSTLTSSLVSDDVLLKLIKEYSKIMKFYWNITSLEATKKLILIDSVSINLTISDKGEVTDWVDFLDKNKKSLNFSSGITGGSHKMEIRELVN